MKVFGRVFLGLLFLLLSGCTSCFTGDVLISTPTGEKEICSLRVGDEILGYSEKENRIVTHKIAKTHRWVSLNYRTIRTQNAILSGVTKNHPIYSEGFRAYVPAEAIKTDDFVRTQKGNSVQMEKVLGAGRTNLGFGIVYDLSVEGESKNYFANHVLVHNKSFIPPVYLSLIKTNISEVFSNGFQARFSLRNEKSKLYTGFIFEYGFTFEDSPGTFYVKTSTDASIPPFETKDFSQFIHASNFGGIQMTRLTKVRVTSVEIRNATEDLTDPMSTQDFSGLRGVLWER